jgi:hypothetical protein
MALHGWYKRYMPTHNSFRANLHSELVGVKIRYTGCTFNGYNYTIQEFWRLGTEHCIKIRETSGIPYLLLLLGESASIVRLFLCTVGVPFV